MKTYTQIFIAALFINIQKVEKLQCPSADECLNKMWYIYIQRNIFIYKKDEVLIHATI